MTDAPISPEAASYGRPREGWRRRWFTVMFESDTPSGRRFDLALLVAVALSVLVVILESVQPLAERHARLFLALEWTFTLIFTVEYVARLLCVERPFRYARSFFGVVDLAAVLPMYAATFVPALHVLIDIRILRMLRAFRILKLTAYVHEYSSLGEALLASRRKIAVFLSVVALIVVVFGTVMYVIEGPEHGFTNIPVAIGWAISTMTTVGGGDVAPHTTLGRALSTIVMLVGWGILAVPTGIVTAEMTMRRLLPGEVTRACAACGTAAHSDDARYCHRCGTPLA